MLESLLLILMFVQEGDLEKTKLVLERSLKKDHNFLIICKLCFRNVIVMLSVELYFVSREDVENKGRWVQQEHRVSR